MILRRSALAALALLSAAPYTRARSPADIPPDTPVSQLLRDASLELAGGNSYEALGFLDAAITRDPQNYLTFFKRGAAYLSLGRTTQAQNDFDRVLELKPGFEGALLQRAKIRARKADWVAARKDYDAAGKAGEIAQLEQAQAAAVLATEAARKKDWEACITHASTAIMVAGAAYDIRKTRATCRFEKGDVAEGIADLQHLLQINTGDIKPYLQSSAMYFYSLANPEMGLKQVAQCLQSDPDSKPCMKLRRREKTLDKDLKKVRQLFEKRQFASGTKLLVDRGQEAPGLLKEVKTDFNDYVEQGYIYKNAPQGLYQSLVEMACEGYTEMNSIKKGVPYCDEALQLNPTFLHSLLNQAQRDMDGENFEAAIRILTTAKEHHQHQRIEELLRKAQILRKRSEQKDYYKVLGVDRDADERQIKKAFRDLVKINHPDKAQASGLTPEEAQKKMAAINEAYEVLSDPELKRRFDNGDDPNNPEQQQGGHAFHGSPFGGPGQQFFFQQGGGGGGGFPGAFKYQHGFGF